MKTIYVLSSCFQGSLVYGRQGGEIFRRSLGQNICREVNCCCCCCFSYIHALLNFDLNFRNNILQEFAMYLFITQPHLSDSKTFWDMFNRKAMFVQSYVLDVFFFFFTTGFFIFFGAWSSSNSIFPGQMSNFIWAPFGRFAAFGLSWTKGMVGYKQESMFYCKFYAHFG